MVDLNSYDPRQRAEEGVWVDLVLDGETVYGDDDEPVQFRVRGAADPEVQALVLKGMNAPQNRTPDEVLRADLELAQVAVVGWTDNFVVGGEKLPCSKKNVRVVMGNPVVRRTILREIFNEGNFMPKP